MPLAVVEGLHLAEHPGAGVPRYFVDYLHRVLLPCVDVHASLHRGVRALAQYFACQLVKVCNNEILIINPIRRDNPYSTMFTSFATTSFVLLTTDSYPFPDIYLSMRPTNISSSCW